MVIYEKKKNQKNFSSKVFQVRGKTEISSKTDQKIKLKSFIGYHLEPDNLCSIGIFTPVSKIMIIKPISEISGFTLQNPF